MNLAIPRAALLELADHAASVAPPSSPSKIVQNVRLDAEAGALTARATDYCLSYEGRRGAAVGKAGACLVNARHLRDVVAVLHDQPVTVAVERNALTLATGRRRFTLPTQDAADFPETRHADGGASAELDATGLAATLRRTHYAQAEASRKPELAATRITARGGDVRAEATDATRAAVDSRPAVAGAPADLSVLAPEWWVEVVLRRLGDAARARLSATADRVTVDVGEDRWTTLSHREALPDLVAVVRAITTTSALVVDRVDLVEALDASLSSGDADLVTLACDPAEGRLLLTAEAFVDGGHASHDELPAAFRGTPPPKYGLNRRHMLDALRPLECPKVELRFTDETSPVVLADPGDESFCCAIAAVRV